MQTGSASFKVDNTDSRD